MFDETGAEAWRLRYGGEPPPDMPAIDRLLTHRSVRKFDDRAIDEATMMTIFAAGQSAATSSNLHLWSAVSVDNPDTRDQIAHLCADQDQIRTAARFFAFFADHDRLRTAANEVGEAAEGLDYHEYYVMAIIDAALAAERMVCAAELLGIGTVYIGALRNDVDAVAELLAAPSGTVPLFGLCLGWPHPDAKADIKPRPSQDCIWYRDRFPERPSVGDYDARMAAFYESQGMSTSASWAMRSGRRVDNHHLTGRERLGPFVKERGLDLR